MKYKTIILTLAAASFFVGQAFAQDSPVMTQQEVQAQNRNDENRMADAKLDRKETKASKRGTTDRK